MTDPEKKQPAHELGRQTPLRSRQIGIDAWVEGIPAERLHYSFQQFYHRKGLDAPKDVLWIDDDGNPVDHNHWRKKNPGVRDPD